LSDFTLVFLGSAPFAVPSLRLLVTGGYPVSAVITRPDRPAGRGRKIAATAVKKEAQQYGLTVSQPENKGQLLEVLQKIRPQLLINVAYGMILPEAVLLLPPQGCINLHPSLLPRYRGAAPIQRAIMAGDTLTGVTILFMSMRLDAGDIILQETAALAQEENFGDIHDRLADCGATLLCKAIDLLRRGQVSAIPQDDGMAAYAPPLTREEEKINWSDPALKIFNQIRALAPYPGAYTSFRGSRLKIWKAALPQPGQAATGGSQYSPGTVCRDAADSLTVQCGEGILPLLAVQPEGKRRMDLHSFIQGYRPQVGEIIG
jgi:methionyl-tRNA formyltransferase